MEIIMDDMERYGDYNEIDEPPRKSRMLLCIKIVALTLCFSVVGFIAFRLIMFNYYPKEMKKLYFNDTLTAYYKETDGNIGAKTQKLKAPYDDAKSGNFFCDHLIIIPGAGQVQISVRYNQNLLNKLKEELSLTDKELSDKDLFSFVLYEDRLENGESDRALATPDVMEQDSFMMYRYYKLVFDGIDFPKEEKDRWFILQIYVKGQKSDKPYAKVWIYDSTEEHYSIKDYKLSGGEKP